MIGASATPSRTTGTAIVAFAGGVGSAHDVDRAPGVRLDRECWTDGSNQGKHVHLVSPESLPPPVGLPGRISDHSHSIVPGGFEVMSYTTRLIPRTSLMIRLLIRPSSSYGSCAQSAVMPSVEVTARTAQVIS